MSKNILITLTLLFYHFSIAQHSDANKTNTSLNLDWKSRGPSNYSGITRAILWDKDDENTLYTGGIASGIYKSINKGESWFKLDSYADNNPSIASFAQSINGTIFVGTGSILGGSPEGALYSLAFLGNGIYKSSDNGNTWSHIQATSSNSPLLSSSEWTHVRAMATHPINTNILMVGNNSGVRISVNAESVQPEFFNALGIGPNVSDVKFTSDGKEAWAAANGRLYHSTDVLNNFTTFNINSPQLTGANRAQLTLSTVDNNGDYTIYASFASVSGCLLGIYKSEDKGANWTLLTSSGSYDPFQYPSSGCQGWYSHSLAVNPINKDILYIGGVTLGGFDSQGNLIQIDNIINETANNYLKSDKHFMLFNPQNAHEMLFGTEGGTYFCNQTITNYPSNLSFVSKNNGLNTSISFNADINKAGKILIGSYYFATRYIDYNQSNPYDAIDIWDETNATTEISNYNDGVIFYSGIFGNLKKSVNFGITNFPFTDSNIDPAGCNFVTCSPLNPSESCNDILFTGTDFINENFLFEDSTHAKYFVSTKCGTNFFICTNPTSLTNAPLFSSITVPNQSGMRTMDVSKNGDRLVAGSGSRVIIIDSLNYFTPSIPNNTSLNTAQLVIQNFNLASVGISFISGIAIDKNDHNHIIVVEDTYGSTTKVARTFDGGLNWEIIHNNLPEIPIYDCIIDANNSSNYILATHDGIYTSNDAGTSWQEDNMGIGKLPIFRVRQEWVLEEDCHVLLAATVGNGIYTSTSLTSCNRNVEDEVWGVYNPINDIRGKDLDIKVYPNPAQDNFTIEIETILQDKLDVEIFDVFGKQVSKSKINTRLIVETSSWAPGMFFIQIGNTFKKIMIK